MRLGRLLLIIIGFGILGFALGTLVPPPRSPHGPPSFPQDDPGTPAWVGIAAMAAGLTLIGAGMRTASRARG